MRMIVPLSFFHLIRPMSLCVISIRKEKNHFDVKVA